MGWIGLHTSPNKDPHATICYWRIEDDEEDVANTYAAHSAIQELLVERRSMGWKGTYPFIVNELATFGSPSDPQEVARLIPAFGREHEGHDIVERFKPFHRSQWEVKLHVTAHRNRPFFEFKWIALHQKLAVNYWKLTP